jgi:hypothetical protein
MSERDDLDKVSEEKRFKDFTIQGLTLSGAWLRHTLQINRNGVTHG